MTTNNPMSREYEKITELVAYYNEHGRYPHHNTPLGMWLSNMREANDENVLHESVRNLLDSECPGWCDDQETISLSKAHELVAYHNEHAQYPHSNNTPLGMWLHSMRSAARGNDGNVYESVRNLLDSECPGWF